MRQIFGYDNPFFRTLGKIADLILLNLLFLLCSLPIVTIGASWTAMYHVTLKMADNQEGYIAPGFWKAFKQNFKQATGIWLIVLAAGLVLGLDYVILNNLTLQIKNILLILLIPVIFLYFMFLLYLFPSLAYFENTSAAIMRNAFVMAVVNLPYTLAMLAVTILPILISFSDRYVFVYSILFWSALAFSLMAFIKSLLLRRVFRKYSQQSTS